MRSQRLSRVGTPKNLEFVSSGQAHSPRPSLDIVIGTDDGPVVAAGQVDDKVWIHALADEMHRAVTEQAERSAPVLAADRLGRRPVNLRSNGVHPPHDIA